MSTDERHGVLRVQPWHHPETKFFEDVDAHSDEYLQCVGSAQALTVEMRVKSGPGYDHWVLATAPAIGDKDHTITWDDDFSTQVHAEEVFTSEQAAPHFVRTIDPATLQLRCHDGS